MLQTIRDKVTGWIAATIIFLLVIPFAFWGINSYFGQGVDVKVLKINGKEITLQEYQQTYQLMRQQRQRSGNNTLLNDEQESELKQQTLDGLINRELQNQVNASIGLRIGDSQLSEAIRSISAFQGIEGFDNALYESYIYQTGFSVPAFERQLRDDLVSDQIRYGMIETEFLTEREVSTLSRLLNQTRDIEYAILSSTEDKENSVVTEEDILAVYQAQSQSFMVPEQVKIAYIDLSLQKLADEVLFTEQDLQDYYETNRVNYEVEEQRSIKQIFINLEENSDEDTTATARTVADTLLSGIREGLSFEKAVEEKGKDSGFNMEVSDQEFLTMGVMDPEVDEVIFGLNEGDVSEPIVTDAGIFIVKLTRITGGKTTTFDTVREQLEIDYRHDQAETVFFELADKLASLAYENPDSLEVASNELDLPIHNSDSFSRDRQGDDYLSNPKIISASFSEDVLINGNNSEPVEIDDDHIIVLRVVEHMPEKKKPLEDVRDSIVTRLKYDQAREKTQKRGEQIIGELKNDVSREEITEKYALDWKIGEAVKRGEMDINPVILSTAFSAGRPEDDKPVYGGSSLASGDYAIVIVNAVDDQVQDALNDEELQSIKFQLLQMVSIDSWSAFLMDLKSRADIQVYSDNL